MRLWRYVLSASTCQKHFTPLESHDPPEICPQLHAAHSTDALHLSKQFREVPGFVTIQPVCVRALTGYEQVCFSIKDFNFFIGNLHVTYKLYSLTG